MGRVPHSLSFVIGVDSSIDLSDAGSPGNADVCVEARNGAVFITGPFESWMGFAKVAEFDSADEGEALARRIKADPAKELDALGYDHAGWFTPAGAE